MTSHPAVHPTFAPCPLLPPRPARGLVWRWLSWPAAQLMLVLDDTIANLALPSIQRDLGVAAAMLPWVISAYVLTFGALLLFGGRLGLGAAHRVGLSRRQRVDEGREQLTHPVGAGLAQLSRRNRAASMVGRRSPWCLLRRGGCGSGESPGDRHLHR